MTDAERTEDSSASFSDDSVLSEADADELKAGAKSKRVKPLVASFLRQAAAVIAAERGLNALSHQKLRTLATHLKMPEEQFDEAMEILQQQEQLPSGLNRYESDFVGFIRTEFHNLKSRIMTVSMENKAVGLATRKYQIPEARARQLIHDQAEKMEIGRISKNDAEAYVEELITSRIGDSTSIEDESRQRFYKIGAKWGVAENEIDAIVLETLGENRRLEKPDESRGVGLAVSFLFLLLIGIGAFVTIYAGGFMDDGPGLVEVEPKEDDPPPVVEVEEVQKIPEWWDESGLKNLTEVLLEQDPIHQAMVTNMISDDIQLQKDGALQLVTLAQNNDGRNARDSIEAVCQYYYYSPEQQVVNEVLDRLAGDLNLPHSRLPANQEKLQRIYGANRLLARLNSFSSLADEPRVIYRRQAIEKVIADEFGSRDLGSEQSEYLRTTNRVIAINQWNHLIQTSWSSPGKTSSMVAPLYDLTRTRLKTDELHRLHGRTVMAVLEADSKHWWDLKPEIENAVKNSTTVAVNTWINHYKTTTQIDYRDWLGKTLARKCDIDPDGKSRDEVLAELEEVRYRINRARFSELISRNEMVEKMNGQAIAGYRRTQLTPQKIADLSRLTNLNMLLAPEDQASFRFNEFDKLLAKGAPDLAEMSRKIISQDRQKQSLQDATSSDYRTRTEVFEKLENLEAGQSSARVSVLRRLSEIAPRFEDINYEDAALLADYYLAEWSSREMLGAEKFLAQFSVWPSFALAVADQLDSSEAKLDQAMTLAQYFGEGAFQIEDPIDWKSEISQYVFDSAVRRSTVMTKRVSSQTQQWKFLREDMASLYQQRLNHMGVRAAGESNPSELVVKMIFQLNQNARRQASYPVERAVELVQRQSKTELGELVSLNKILVKLLSQTITDRWPNRFAAVDTLVKSLGQLDSQDRDLATQLLDLEMGLLSLWSIEREAVYQRLISR